MVRLDKWIWAARCFKTRSQATKACAAGQVTVNGEKARASRPVRPDDLVEVWLQTHKRILRVVALADRRGSAEVAATLFDDLTPPPPRAPRAARGARARRRQAHQARPPQAGPAGLGRLAAHATQLDFLPTAPRRMAS